MKILVIEDDSKIADLVKLYLKKEGFDVCVANDGRQGLEMVSTIHPDLIILDLMLPEIDGLTIAKAVFQKDKIPMIMLTAKDEEIDRIIGLELGADDYMSKPFSPRELVSRVKAVLRRCSISQISEAEGITRIKNLEIDHHKFTVKKDGQKVLLTRKEFALLYALSKNPGRVFSRKDLMDRLYTMDDEVIYDRTIDVHISNLRNKLDDKSQQIIATVSGIGYKMREEDEI
jgi:DNA-binding response OmpR family regulator